jgi:hypothetical protein
MTDRKRAPPVSAAKCCATWPKEQEHVSSRKDANRRAARRGRAIKDDQISVKGPLGTLCSPERLVKVKPTNGKLSFDAGQRFA